MTRFASLLILAVVGTASAETLEDVQKTLAAKFEKHKSLTADMKMSMHMGHGMSADSTGTVEFMIVNWKERFRSEMRMKMSHGPQTMETKIVNIYDGTDAYTISEMMGQKQVAKTKPSQMAGRAGGKAFLEELKREMNLKLLPDAKVGEASTYVIEATPKQANPRTPGRMRYYFAKDTGIMMKMETLSPGGETALTVTLTNIKMDPSLDPKRFEFTPEPGTNVLDMTGR
ncbi:MAG: hypothetical protein PVI86_03910 [Phycisphaerae bacterium]